MTQCVVDPKDVFCSRYYQTCYCLNCKPVQPGGPNIALLRKTLEHITAHPEEWSQGTWYARVDDYYYLPRARKNACGTAACLAGTTVVTILDYTVVNGDLYNPEGKRVVSFKETARVELNLTASQADDLFDANNTLHRLWKLAKKYSGGEIEIPIDVPRLSRNLAAQERRAERALHRRAERALYARYARTGLA